MSTPDVPAPFAMAPPRSCCMRCGGTATVLLCDRCHRVPADDFPRPATRAEKLAELHQCLDFHREQQEAKCRP